MCDENIMPNLHGLPPPSLSLSLSLSLLVSNSAGRINFHPLKLNKMMLLKNEEIFN